MGSGAKTYEWVDTDAAFADACKAAAAEDVFAVDTEFHRERTYYPHVALLQMRWVDATVLVDTLVVDMTPLAGLLESDSLPILHAADQDLEVFRRACGTLPRRMFDTQIVANFAGFSTPSLASLAEKVVGLRLPKGDRMTDWTRRPLSESQCTYAASDVAHLVAIRDHLIEDLEPKGRLAWAEDECAAALARAATPSDADVAWWRIKEARQCRGATRALAQELAAWRERRAQATDVPVRFVLADLAVAAIAQAARRRSNSSTPCAVSADGACAATSPRRSSKLSPGARRCLRRSCASRRPTTSSASSGRLPPLPLPG